MPDRQTPKSKVIIDGEACKNSQTFIIFPKLKIKNKNLFIFPKLKKKHLFIFPKLLLCEEKVSSITDVPSYLQYTICGSPCRWMYSHMMSVMLYIQNIIYIYIFHIFGLGYM